MAPPTITHGTMPGKTAHPGVTAAGSPIPASVGPVAALPAQPSTEAVELIAARLESIVARSAISSGRRPRGRSRRSGRCGPNCSAFPAWRAPSQSPAARANRHGER